MPDLKIHEEDSLKKYGKKFTELHQWMDEPVKIMGRGHRKYRHDPNITPIEAKRMFGKNADNACLDHIILDTEEFIKNKKEQNTKKTEFSQQISIRIPNEIMKNVYGYARNCNKNNITQTILFFIRNGAINLDMIEKTKEFLDEQEIIMGNLFKSELENKTENIDLINPYTRTLERDNYQCRKCGSAKNITNPTKLPLDFNNKTAAGFGIESYITLCDKCKKEFQNYVLTKLSLEQFIEWFFS